MLCWLAAKPRAAKVIGLVETAGNGWFIGEACVAMLDGRGSLGGAWKLVPLTLGLCKLTAMVWMLVSPRLDLCEFGLDPHFRFLEVFGILLSIRLRIYTSISVILRSSFNVMAYVLVGLAVCIRSLGDLGCCRHLSPS